ncbi:MAG: MarR family transcriptional regulator [Muribaculaceae bacterium]|nr:MarR family transcriptional regulator [Muribaculaceae bacterium]
MNIYRGPNVGCMIGTAYQTLTAELGSALKEAGIPISVPEYLILRSLYDSEGIQICKLATILGKDKGAVSRCVKGLSDKGFVHTEQVSHKCLKVFLSPTGIEIKPAVMQVALSRHEALASILTPQEREIFLSVLHKIINKHNI